MLQFFFCFLFYEMAWLIAWSCDLWVWQMAFVITAGLSLGGLTSCFSFQRPCSAVWRLGVAPNLTASQAWFSSETDLTCKRLKRHHTSVSLQFFNLCMLRMCHRHEETEHWTGEGRFVLPLIGGAFYYCPLVTLFWGALKKKGVEVKIRKESEPRSYNV